jgi:hypothetical protein
MNTIKALQKEHFGAGRHLDYVENGPQAAIGSLLLDSIEPLLRLGDSMITRGAVPGAEQPTGFG